MKYVFILTIILTFSQLDIKGQTAVNNSSICTDKDIENFSSRGINLGMKFDEVITLFIADGKINIVNYSYQEGKAAERTQSEYTFEYLKESAQSRANNNYGGYFISGIVPKASDRFDGISSYDFGFIDGKLSFMRIDYTKPSWESMKQFIDILADVSRLPKMEYWQAGKLKCGNSEITAQFSGHGERTAQLEVDQQFNQILRARQKESENKKRERDIKVFKP